MLKRITGISPRANNIRAGLFFQCNTAVQCRHLQSCCSKTTTSTTSNGNHHHHHHHYKQQTLDQQRRRWLSNQAKIYRWNDVLFGSSFNEIVRPESVHFDMSQYNLFREKNFIKSFDKGFFSLMPFVVRSYERLIRLLDHELHAVGCQKIMMPALVGKHLWVKSERWETSGEEVFRVRDRHQNEYCLAPTQEETVTQILASTNQLSFRQLPVYLYQITPKYRDELRTKYGLLRAREFIMKDLYTFDKNEDLAIETYEKVCKAYEKIFSRLELPIIKTVGSVGSIGGKYSHEWLLETPLGEDEVYSCRACGESFNAELVLEQQLEAEEAHGQSSQPPPPPHCLNCGNTDQALLPRRRALELGHSFLLSDRYSSKMGAYYLSEHTNRQVPLQMGCYGLGISRILAGSVEYLSSQVKENVELMAKVHRQATAANTGKDSDAAESADPTSNTIHHNTAAALTMLRWPKVLVPFKVCLILPKRESKEEKGRGGEFARHLAAVIGARFEEDVLIDDRNNLTVGKRLLTAKAIGIPFVIVAGRNIIDSVPKFEMINVYRGEEMLLTQAETLHYLERYLKAHFLYNYM